MIILSDGAYITSDRYHAWAEDEQKNKTEIGEYSSAAEARGYANRYLFECKGCKMPTVFIKRVMTVEEYIR